MAAHCLFPLLQHLQEQETALPVSKSLTTLWKTPSLIFDSIVIVSYLSGSWSELTNTSVSTLTDKNITKIHTQQMHEYHNNIQQNSQKWLLMINLTL